jgi:hypothetical protein
MALRGSSFEDDPALREGRPYSIMGGLKFLAHQRLASAEHTLLTLPKQLLESRPEDHNPEVS